MSTIAAILGCVLQLVIVALALSEWRRRRRAETIVVLLVIQAVSAKQVRILFRPKGPRTLPAEELHLLAGRKRTSGTCAVLLVLPPRR
jgi:hypothetical protein